MSDQSSPVGFLFEMQRDALRQTGTFFESLIDVTADVGEDVANGIETHREIQEQTLELTRESIHRSLAVASTFSDSTAGVEGMPEGNVNDLHETVDSMFDSLLDQHAQTFDTVDEEYERFGDEAGNTLNEQIDLLIEFNKRIETQVVELAEQFVEQAEDADDLTEQFESQLEQVTEQFEQQAERFSDREGEFEPIEITESS